MERTPFLKAFFLFYVFDIMTNKEELQRIKSELNNLKLKIELIKNNYQNLKKDNKILFFIFLLLLVLMFFIISF